MPRGVNRIVKKLVPLVALLLLGCTKQSDAPSVVYSVAGFTDTTNEWVVDQVDRVASKRTRFTLVCDFYHQGKAQIVSGPAACDLTPGQTITPNPLGRSPGEFLDVWPRGDKFSITRGSGDNRVIEQFTVKSARAVAYSGGI
jgi:hypothetical protein